MITTKNSINPGPREDEKIISLGGMCYENVINSKKYYNFIKKCIESDDFIHLNPFKYAIIAIAL